MEVIVGLALGLGTARAVERDGFGCDGWWVMATDAIWSRSLSIG
jgi:hypothetical protein